ncbi:hypothetical protein AWJ20_770 [Sugiyamaella lignohabitans]|uniref:Gag1-like clamp domain-containing protein n=1 Tax=Sugiyamaella lignohabitans TaxID=796027 RepID=A0A167D5P4_9ASCO|nr:uncharacterized protein AWJ20_770 [Sugiyamaella lignohabitans]ANB12514.1 hypothetical protein AWJ20_770 [Sugiyamaella lignohabitans]
MTDYLRPSFSTATTTAPTKSRRYSQYSVASEEPVVEEQQKSSFNPFKAIKKMVKSAFGSSSSKKNQKLKRRNSMSGTALRRTDTAVSYQSTNSAYSYAPSIVDQLFLPRYITPVQSTGAGGGGAGAASGSMSKPSYLFPTGTNNSKNIYSPPITPSGTRSSYGGGERRESEGYFVNDYHQQMATNSNVGTPLVSPSAPVKSDNATGNAASVNGSVVPSAAAGTDPSAVSTTASATATTTAAATVTADTGTTAATGVESTATATADADENADVNANANAKDLTASTIDKQIHDHKGKETKVREELEDDEDESNMPSSKEAARDQETTESTSKPPVNPATAVSAADTNNNAVANNQTAAAGSTGPAVDGNSGAPGVAANGTVISDVKRGPVTTSSRPPLTTSQTAPAAIETAADSDGEFRTDDEAEEEEERINPGYKEWKRIRREWTKGSDQIVHRESALVNVPQSMYPKIYQCLVQQARPLRQPLNLADALKVIKAGWVSDGQWEAAAAASRSAVAAMAASQPKPTHRPVYGIKIT